jgi:hypothetical protein
MNERATLGNQAVTVSQMVRAAALPGMTRVVVTVTIEGVGAAGPYSSRYFTLADAAGNTYSATGDAADALGAGQLAAGAAVRGALTFEVPATATGLVLHYQPLVLLGIVDPLRIALADNH